MTLEEFKREFQTHYDMNSAGAPSINDYEMSLFLTQAVREVVDEIYGAFEQSEYVKRGLGPLIQETNLDLVHTNDPYIGSGVATEAILPKDLYFILQENVDMMGRRGYVEVVSEDLDSLNKTMKNPFRKPSPNRVLRIQIGGQREGENRVRIYSTGSLKSYRVKYIKKHKPIIVSDLTDSFDLMGDETIDGETGPSMTELPDFLHDKIVRRAVVLAIKSFRDNSLQTQIQV